MSISRCLCPEAKLIIMLGILGAGIGALSGYLSGGGELLKNNKELAALFYGLIGFGPGLLTGKAIGEVSRRAGLCFFYPEAAQDENESSSSDNERKSLNVNP